MREAVIVSACRTAVGRAKRGSLIHTRPDYMASVVIKEAIKRAGIDPKEIEDVVMGCAMPEAEQGMNVARLALHLANLPESIPAMTINRYCSSGMQAIWNVVCDVNSGAIDIGVGGGTETMTMIPMGGNKIVPNPDMAKTETGWNAYVGMGETAENVAHKYDISREEQDKLAVDSNERAMKANENGDFKEQIVPLPTVMYNPDGTKKEFVFDVDEGPRPGTTMEVLGKLRPAFWDKKKGTVTAGNSSQMSDGAGAVVVMEKSVAEKKGIKPLAKFHGCVTVAFDPAYMGIGPALAIPRLMEKFGKPLGLTDLEQIDVIELNEAFASQAVYCVKELGLQKMWDEGRVNPTGGAVALGHPLGATGAKLTTQIIYWMKNHNLKWGIVSMCIGGGMGAAGLFENLTLE